LVGLAEMAKHEGKTIKFTFAANQEAVDLDNFNKLIGQ